jgi:hypothetical protein
MSAVEITYKGKNKTREFRVPCDDFDGMRREVREMVREKAREFGVEIDDDGKFGCENCDFCGKEFLKRLSGVVSNLENCPGIHGVGCGFERYNGCLEYTMGVVGLGGEAQRCLAKPCAVYHEEILALLRKGRLDRYEM